MNISDGRGQWTKQKAIKNKSNIKQWFDKNPGSTIRACCEALGLSYKTVRKHIDSLQSESDE